MITIIATAASDAAIVSFAIYLVIVFLLAWFANRAQSGKSFVSEYFLGSRNIGLWGFALTYAATAASGGSFMGFPALIYSHGWVLAWWIAGYCVAPLIALGLLAKRINQVSRLAGAITVPELMRKRFDSSIVGTIATLMVILFMFVFLMAQFQAGANIMAVLLADVEPYQKVVQGIETTVEGWWWIGQSDGDYLLCLVFFAVAVVIYTSYGGYLAVVWTDVMQGIVMLIGVMIMLCLALYQVRGLSNATQQLAKMTPPEFGQALIQPRTGSEEFLPKGTWLRTEAGGLARLVESTTTEKDNVRILFLTQDEGAEDQVTDQINESFVAVEVEGTREIPAYGHDRPGVYVSAPGPHQTNPQGFLSVALALSFFVFWNFSGAGQPSYMVRQMSFRDTRILRRSIMVVSVFFGLIYFPLVVIFTSARILLPGMEAFPADRVMPTMAAHLTTVAGVPWLAGLLFAAPFAAVMSSVDSFLLLVSSGVVRDIYQQSINPRASDKTLKRLSYTTTILVGILAVIAMLNPPPFLQTLIIFASTGLGASFLAPVAFGLFWKRMTAGGAVAGMLVGGSVALVLYFVGYKETGKFGPYNLLGLDPFIWGTLISCFAVVGVSLQSAKPHQDLIERYFGRE